MKCKGCGKKVFKNIVDKDGRIGRFRMCVNCGLLNMFGHLNDGIDHNNKKLDKKKGEFEYDFEN